jgi:hypothetical protein
VSIFSVLFALFLVLIVAWVFLGVPAYISLRIAGFLETPEEETFKREARDKASFSEPLPPRSKRSRLKLAGVLFLAQMGVYALIWVVRDQGWDEEIGLAFLALVRFALPIATLCYLAAAFVLRRKRKALERQLALEQKASCSLLKRIVRDHAALDWTAYARYSVWHGRALLGTSFVLQMALVIAAILIFVEADLRNRGFYILGTLTIAATVFVGVKMSRRARPHYARLELERMISSRVPPVLFLRGFASDRESFDNPSNVFGNPERWIDWKLEDVIAYVFRRYGPVVALGQNETALAPTSHHAARLFVRTDWKKNVQDLCEVSRVIVVRASFSDGVKWELNEVLSSDRRARCVILLANDQGKPMRKSEYLRFRDHVATTCAVELPLEGWNSWYLWFDEDGTAKLIEAPSADSGVGAATYQLIDELASAGNARWQRLSVWDFYTPLEYRVLASALPVTLVAIIGASLLYLWTT